MFGVDTIVSAALLVTFRNLSETAQTGGSASSSFDDHWRAGNYYEACELKSSQRCAVKKLRPEYYEMRTRSKVRRQVPFEQAVKRYLEIERWSRIGEGSFGTVYRYRDGPTGEARVVKIMRNPEKDKKKGRFSAAIQDEIDFVRKVRKKCEIWPYHADVYELITLGYAGAAVTMKEVQVYEDRIDDLKRRRRAKEILAFELNTFADHYETIMAGDRTCYYNFDIKPANVAWEPFDCECDAPKGAGRIVMIDVGSFSPNQWGTYMTKIDIPEMKHMREQDPQEAQRVMLDFLAYACFEQLKGERVSFRRFWSSRDADICGYRCRRRHIGHRK